MLLPLLLNNMMSVAGVPAPAISEGGRSQNYKIKAEDEERAILEEEDEELLLIVQSFMSCL